MYLAIGCGALIIWLGQGMGFAYATEKQTHRVRREAFRHILRQDVGFFDLEQSSAGHLTSLLSSGPTGLNGLSGSVIGALLSFLATILGGIILSLIIGWKFALICTATIPFVAGFGWLRLAMLSLFTEKINKTHQDSAAYAGEAISAIRTVASMTLETRVLENYNKILSRQSRRSINSILQASVLYAASQSVTFLCAALAFWYGGTLLSTHEYSVLQFFICFAALISGSQTAGVVFSYAPGMSKAIGAAQELKSLFDRSPKIDIWSTAGDQISKGKCVGEIELRNVSYTYPSREDRMVINDLSMTILPGQYVALVGRSGCGKSTIIGLLERFFDPTSGRILIDKQDISELDVNNYRSLISLVGQDPALYSGTIRENLMLGCDSNVSEEDIMQACREANIYDLINSLP
jgi:ATP-binding cassette subfamily B (MDR/TAP) protein 1